MSSSDNYLTSDTDALVDKYVTDINSDKFVLLSLITVLAIYSGYFADSVAQYGQSFFSSPLFQIPIFIIICYIMPLSPSLGISLALAILVTLQCVKYIKIRNLMDGFSPMNPSQMNNQHEVYLSNPLQKAGTNVPTTDLRLVSLDDKYNKMIKEGRTLLDDSNDIKNDIEKRPDTREQRIADTIEITGKRMIQSGINRISGSDDGQIASNSPSELGNGNGNGKFIKYDKSMTTNNHEILSKYDELQNNFNKLPNIGSVVNFEKQFHKTQKNELELLELIYKNKKDSLSKKKQEKVNELFDSIRQSYNKNDVWQAKLKELEQLLR